MSLHCKYGGECDGCMDCYDDNLYCQECENIINDSYYKIDDNIICENCIENFREEI